MNKTQVANWLLNQFLIGVTQVKMTPRVPGVRECREAIKKLSADMQVKEHGIELFLNHMKLFKTTAVEDQQKLYKLLPEE